MRVFIVALLLAVMPIAVCAGEVATKGVWDDWFGMAEIQGGMNWSFETQEWSPAISAPVVGYKDVRGVVGLDFEFDGDDPGPRGAFAAVTYDLGSLEDHGVSVPGAQHFGLNIGPFARYDLGTREFSYGVMATILDISFGDGNVKRQKNR